MAGTGFGLGLDASRFAEQDLDSGVQQELTLRITTEARDPSGNVNSSTKSLRFPNTTYVYEAMDEISNVTNVAKTADMGLLLKSPDPTKSRWLERNKTLRYYDIHSLDELVYKSMNRPLRVHMLDGSNKMMLINDSHTVEEIVMAIGEKLQISNPEEFSLMLMLDDETPEEKKERLKREKRLKKRGILVEEDWLKSDMTLHAQGVPPDAKVLLKKKFFYYDADIDHNDPQTLSLLFEQLRHDVISGALPVKLDEAISFAGLQCQVLLGPHDPGKHSKKSIDVREYLPEEYRKVKKIHQKVFQSHASLGKTLTVSDAKFRYVQLARSLDTFGISVFRVQEPKRDKNGRLTKKFQEALLGISRSHLYRLDPLTKEPRSDPFALTQLRRWAPSKNSLTLDYGDHTNEYYTVLTDEGDKIAALIAGYIDIILGQRRDRERLEEQEQRAVEETLINPSHAQSIVHSSSPARQMRTSRVSQVSSLKDPAKRAAGAAVSDRQLKRELSSCISQIGSGAQFAEPDEDPDLDDNRKLTNLQNARDMLADILGDLALTGASMLNPDSNTDALANGQRLVDLRDEMVQAASQAGGATDEVAAALDSMDAALKQMLALGAGEDGDPDAAAAAMGSAVSALLSAAEVPDARPLCMDDLLNAAGDLNSALLGLTEMDFDGELADAQAKVKALADELASGVTLSGAAIIDDKVRTAMDDRSGQLQTALDGLVSLAEINGVAGADLDALLNVAGSLSTALTGLTEGLQNADENVDHTKEIVQGADAVREGVLAVVNADSSKKSLLAVKQVAASAAALGELAEAETEIEVCPALQTDLQEMAQRLAGALETLAAARAAASSDPSSANMDALRGAAIAVGEHAQMIGQRRQQRRALTDLARASRQLAQSSALLDAEVAEAGECASKDLEKRLDTARSRAQGPNAALDDAALLYLAAPDSKANQKALLDAAKNSSRPLSKFVLASKSAAPSFEDTVAGDAVRQTAAVAGEKHAVMNDLLRRSAEACWDIDLEAAREQLNDAQQDLLTCADDARKETLPEKEYYENAESAAASTLYALQSLSTTAGDIAAAVACGSTESLGAAAKTSASNGSMFANAVITSQKCRDDPAARKDISTLGTAQQVCTALAAALAAAEHAMVHHSNAEARAKATNALAKFRGALGEMQETVPGLGTCLRVESDVDSLVKQFVDLASLSPPADASFEAFSADLLASAEALAKALKRLVHGARGADAEDIARLANAVAAAFADLATHTEGAAATAPSEASGIAILEAFKVVGESTSATSAAVRALVGALEDDEDGGEAETAAMHEANETTKAAIEELACAVEAAASGEGGAYDDLVAAVTSARDRVLGAVPANVDGAHEDHVRALITACNDLSAGVDALGNSPSESSAGALPPLVVALATAAAATAATTAGGAPAGGVNAAAAKKSSKDISSGVKALIKARKSKPKQVIKGAAAVAKLALGMSSRCKTEAKTLPEGADRTTMLELCSALKTHVGKLGAAAKAAQQADDDARGKAVDKVLQRAAGVAQAAQAITAEAKAHAGASGADEGAQALQGQLMAEARRVLDAVVQELGAAKGVASGSGGRAGAALLKSAQRKARGAVGKLKTTAKGASPGQAECAAAIDAIETAVNSLEDSMVAASGGDLETRDSMLTFATCKSKLEDTAINSLGQAVTKVVDNAVDDPARMASGVAKITAAANALAKYAHDAAAAVDPDDHAEDQSALLASAHALAMDMRALIDTARCARDPGFVPSTLTDAAAAVDASISTFGEALMTVGEAATGEAGGSPSEIAKKLIADASQTLHGPAAGVKGMTYADYQTDVKSKGKKLGQGLLHLGKAARKKPKSVSKYALEIARMVPDLFTSVAVLAKSSSKSGELVAAGDGVATRLGTLIDACADLAAAPEKAKAVAVGKLCSGKAAKAVSALLALAKADASSAQAADEAAVAIEDALGDLDTISFMLTSGSLQSNSDEPYGTHEPVISKATGKVAKSVNALEAAASAGDTEATGDAAAGLAGNVGKLLAALEAAIPSLPEFGAQQSLLDAAKALAEALSAFTNDAIAQSEDGEPLDAHLKTAVTKTLKSFLKINGKVEEMASSGRRQLATAMDVVQQAVESMQAPPKADAKRTTTPAEIGELASGVGTGITRLVLASKKGQKQAGAAASDTARTLVGFIIKCKDMLNESAEEVRPPFVAAVTQLGEAVARMFKTIGKAGGSTKKDRDAHKKLRALASSSADVISQVVHGAVVVANPDEADDADALAAKELKKTAKEIEGSGMKKLNRLRPVRGEGGAMSYEESLVEAAKTIMVAAGGLVRAASAVQKEVVQKKAAGGAEAEAWHVDGDFAEGLIGAARQVAAECRQLVGVAETVVKDKPEHPELRVEAAAQGVSSSTAALVVAGTVAAGVDSKPQQHLKKCGGDVKNTLKALTAISKLHAAAQGGGDDDDDDLDDEGQVAANRADMEARLAVLEAQRQLEAARNRVLKRNKAKYKRRG